MNNSQKSSPAKLVLITISVFLVIFSLCAVINIATWIGKGISGNLNINPIISFSKNSSSQIIPTNVDVAKFSSEQEFRNYIAKLSPNSSNYSLSPLSTSDSKEIAAPSTTTGGSTSTQGQVTRYSSTNVQVSGIDEADIVKTDGKSLFLTSQTYQIYYDRIMPNAPIDSNYQYQNNLKTSILNTLPTDKIQELAKIETGGQLLLSSNVLIILDPSNYTNKLISGYDISDQKNPKKLWEVKFDQNQTYIDSRVVGGKLFIITSKSLYNSSNCATPLLTSGARELKINCDQVYYPVNLYNLDSVLTVTKFDVVSGSVENTFTTLAQSSANTVYMSLDNLYLTYQVQPSYLKLLTQFLNSDAKGLLSDSISSRLTELSNYNISENSKLTEAQNAILSYMNSLSQDDRNILQQNLANKFSDFMKNNKRNLLSTKIIKLANANLNLLSQGQVPGYLLNQYSLDEYQGNLRIVTTIDTQNSLYYFGSTNTNNSSSSENDVYILNSNLEKIGQLQGLGLTERIYSARFINSKLYLVTYRQIDPFYIIDLSNPNSPQKTGELKIPGYSGYLHPLDDNHILGVGVENSQLKLSVFDVADSNNPKEVSKFTTSDYYSEALYNAKAFLYDQEKKVIFIPGSQNSYIFKLESDFSLNLKKAVSGLNFSRAVYVNNNLYLIDQNQNVKIFSEDNFELVGQYYK